MTRGFYDDVQRFLFPARGEAGWRDPERGFLGLLRTATGHHRRTLILTERVPQEPGDVEWTEDGLVMSPRYYSRALTLAARSGCGVLHVHTHPGNSSAPPHPPAPSPQDLESDLRELYAVAQVLPEAAPVAAAIASSSGGWSLREYSFGRPRNDAEAAFTAFKPEGGRYRYADRLRVVGEGLRILPANPRGRGKTIDMRAFDSTVDLWGETGQRMLAELTVGIAGLGGVGGILAEHIARMGIGELVLVDFDALDEANLNRAQGARLADARAERLKVDLYEDLTREWATAPRFRVHAYRESAAQERGARVLLDCDFIFCAADSAFARQVLDHAAYAHLIHVVDGGTTLVGDLSGGKLLAGKSQVSAAGPEHPCLECQRCYTLIEATDARQTVAARRYVQRGGTDDAEALRAPSVIASNAMVAALMQLRFMAIALGTTPEIRAGTQRYYIESGTLGRTSVRACSATCGKPPLVGRGDSAPIPWGDDPAFPG